MPGANTPDVRLTSRNALSPINLPPSNLPPPHKLYSKDFQSALSFYVSQRNKENVPPTLLRQDATLSEKSAAAEAPNAPSRAEYNQSEETGYDDDGDERRGPAEHG